MKLLFWTALLAPVLVLAQETAPSLQWGGSVRTDNRVRLHEPYAFSWNEHRLNLTADVKMTTTRFRSELWIRSLGTAVPSTLADLQSAGSLDPAQVLVREAYAEISDFLIPRLDLLAGKQRIAWGKADRLNPTDNLNPYDLEDLWDFGRHLGSTALVVTYYPGDWTISAAILPTFTPAVLPAGDLSAALAPLYPVSTQSAVYSQSVELPSAGAAKQVTAGLRVGTQTAGFDWSLSFVHGREQLPVPVETKFLLSTASALNVQTRLQFPRRSILGFDLAGAIGDAGVWFEAALFFPTETRHRVYAPPLSSGSPMDLVGLTGRRYVRYIAGADYTFPVNIYCNVQYLHGFIHERDPKDLHDYLILRGEWKWWEDRLTLAFLNGALEIGDPAALGDNIAIVYAPELTFVPTDNVEVTVGVRIIDGKGTTTFSAAKDFDEACLKISYAF